MKSQKTLNLHHSASVRYQDIFQNYLIDPKLNCEMLAFDIFIVLDSKFTPWKTKVHSIYSVMGGTVCS